MDRLLLILVSNLVIAGALAVVAAVVTRQSRNPHLAHALWLLVLIKLVTPPLWLLPVPWPQWTTSTEGVTVPVEYADDVIPFDTGGRWLDPIDDQFDRVWGADGSANSVKSSVAVESAQRPPEVVRFVERSWLRVAAGIWIAGMFLVALRTIRGYWQFGVIAARSTPAGPEITRDVARFAAQMGLASTPDVRISEAHIAPLVSTIGRRPVILLPRQLLETLDGDSRRSILLHELAHLRRRDHWVRWFEFVVVVVHWWNPVAWWASYMLRAAAEECCDAWVVWMLPNGRRSYGRALLRTVEC